LTVCEKTLWKEYQTGTTKLPTVNSFVTVPMSCVFLANDRFISEGRSFKLPRISDETAAKPFGGVFNRGEDKKETKEEEDGFHYEKNVEIKFYYLFIMEISWRNDKFHEIINEIIPYLI